MAGTVRWAALALAMVVTGAPLPLSAQTAPTARPQPAPDPAQLAAQAAFEALDLEARRQVQRDLAWAAKFVGNATAEFGPLTYAAIRRFETDAKTGVDGILTPAERAALANAADKARAAAGFTVQNDATSRMRIGIPGKLLVKKSANTSGGSRWQDKDDKVTLDLIVARGDEDLPTLFEKGTSAAVAGRKITYKLLRPEFFVITGETDKGKFYRRMEKGSDGVIRGLSLGYDKAIAAQVDPLIVPIVGTFEAQPGAASAGSQVAARPPTGGAVAPAAPKGKLLTALVVAPGQLLAAEAAVKGCRAPQIVGGGAAIPLEILRADAASGLALLAARGSAPAGAPNLSAAVPLPIAGNEPVENATLLQRDEAGDLLASPARLEKGAEGANLASASLQEGGAGAALIDRRGGLVGLVIAEPQTKFRVAGVVPALRYRFAPAAEIARFTGLAAPAAAARPERSAGELAAAAAPAVLAIRCAP